MVGANNVSARVALDHGVDVLTAGCFRGGITAAVVDFIVGQQRVPLALEARPRWSLLAIGMLIAAQSFCL